MGEYDFECTCGIIKGERNIAYGEDCYNYYPKPNYQERIVRCRDCRHYNPQIKIPPLCDFFESIVEPDGFCAWAEPKEVE